MLKHHDVREPVARSYTSRVCRLWARSSRAARAGAPRCPSNSPLCANLTLDDSLAQEALRAGRVALKTEFDGCAELWWDNLADHLAARNTPQGVAALQALMEDERRFVDVSCSQLWYGTERLIIPG